MIRRFVAAGCLAAVALVGACDRTSEYRNRQCYVSAAGAVVRQSCCETKCKSEEDPWDWDYESSCVLVCYDVLSTPIPTAVTAATPTPTPLAT